MLDQVATFKPGGPMDLLRGIDDELAGLGGEKFGPRRGRPERADRLTELAALLGEGHRGLERGTGEPHDMRPDTGPEHVEDARAETETVIHRADDVTIRYEHSIEVQSTDPIRPHRIDRHAREALRVARHQERGGAAAPASGNVRAKTV